MTHHRGAYLNAVSNILAGNLGQHPVYLWTLPMFHCNGWCFPWTVAAAAGINVCLRKVDPTKIFELISKHGVTHMCGAPIVYNTLINAPDAPKGAGARPVVGLIAGAAPPVAVLEGAESIGIKLTHVYGLTEVYGPASVCAEQPGWDELPADQRAQLKRRQGVPYPLQEAVTVIDPETMREVPRDGETIGEVMFRGNIVMKGYLKNEKATKEAFAGGWFHTGDLGVLDEHGYVIIKDRSKDIIISGGENISSVEVEDVLYKHPAVLFAAVVAKPDPKWGEVPCAFVELKEDASATEAEIIAFCRSQMSGLQDAEGRGVRADPEDVDRQDPEIHAAQSGGFGEGDLGLAAGPLSISHPRNSNFKQPVSADTPSRSRGAFRPRFTAISALFNQRARGMPGARCAR